MFKEIDSKMNLPKIEEEILKFWDEDKTFEKSLEKRAGSPLYNFYDGPPFATGSPHYGHILQSITKDVVPRYWTMRGHKVERKWGWDCHGLPIENLVEKELGITHKQQIVDMGVGKFCEACRTKILAYVPEWKKVIRRLGRWVDMESPYMTMDASYMESVWWVFRELWNKGLVYESYRSMHICPRCETTLSQSEVTEGYKTVKDLSVIAKFELIDEPGAFVLAWTTTPWTLIGNVALAVGEDIDYAKIVATPPDFPLKRGANKEGSSEAPLLFKEGLGVVTSKHYILAVDRLEEVMKDQEYKIVTKIKGRDLVGRAYKPLFDYYSGNEKTENRKNGWRIVAADFVTTEEGTGVVHIAPAFGEDDMKLGKEKNLPFVQHVGMDGIIKPEAGEFAGLHVKPIEDVQATDVEIIKHLAHNNLLFAKEKYEHSYPHCWRCETPLLNYATSSWFVAVTKIKARALELAKEINWSPKHIKEGRFGKWMEGARDWSISRQRYWASVIPIWKCDKCDSIHVIGSIVELEKLSGQTITDLHKDKIDPVAYACTKCNGTMKRIPDVLDTWFDSGSMPYAQLHYPFENKEKFDNNFPADFIGEAQDQTRAWFYYLHAISSSIKDSVAYKNVIVSGIILAEDGKKMSKRLQNYPDPMAMFDKYGADVVRYYMLNSSLLQAENLNFSEKDLAELSRGMFRMLWNTYSFFVLYANIDKWDPSLSAKERGLSPEGTVPGFINVLDRWIVSELNILIGDLNKSMNEYDIVKSARLFQPFIDNLSNWYIRRSRRRFWKSENDSDKESAYQTLYLVLVELSKLMAPFTPFLADEIFKNLTGGESVHLEDYPTENKELINGGLSQDMLEARKIVEAGLSLRAESKIKVRQPLQRLAYTGKKLLRDLEEIVQEEVNIKEVGYFEENIPTEWGDKSATLNNRTIVLDIAMTPELVEEGMARELVRAIQELRKSSGFDISDRIILYHTADSDSFNKIMARLGGEISHEVLAEEIVAEKKETEAQTTVSVDNESVWIGISRKKGQ